MLGDRHQFDVGEAPFLHVGDQTIRQFGVGEQSCARLHVGGGNRLPRCAIRLDPGFIGTGMDPAAQMHLVDRDRLLQRVAAVPLRHPRGVGPAVAVQTSDNGAVVRSHLVLEAIGVSLLVAVTLLGVDFIFVVSTGAKARHEQLPDAARALLHGQVATIPVVAVADD